MCGIVGFIKHTSDHNTKLKPMFDQALYADVFRGKDATGVFRVARGAESEPAKWSKMAVPSHEYWLPG